MAEHGWPWRVHSAAPDACPHVPSSVQVLGATVWSEMWAVLGVPQGTSETSDK